MKKILYLITLILITSYSAEAGKRVMLNSTTNTMENLAVPAAEVLKPTVLPINSTDFLNSIEQPEIPPFSPKVDYPIMLLDDYHSYGYQTWADSSDSSFIYTSYVDTTKKTLTGYWDFPDDMGQFGAAIGIAQFIPGLNGNFRIDTVAFRMLVLTSRPRVKDKLYFLPLKLPNVNLHDTAQLRTNRGIRIDYNGDDWVPLTSDYIEIPPDTINTRWEEIGGTTYYRWTIIPLNPPIEVPKNENIGFLVTQLKDASQQDSIRFPGVFEWQFSQYQTYGCMMRRNNGNDTIHSTYYFNRYWTANENGDWPKIFNSLNRVNVRQNFKFLVFGDYDGTDNVIERTANESASFYLEQNVPNPVSNLTNISFSLNKTSVINLNIYNLLGEIVADVVCNKEFEQGIYSVEFDATNLPQGSYFYMLNANGRTLTKTMHIVK